MPNITLEQKRVESSIRPYRRVNANARAKFLRALKRTGNMTYSADHAGIRVRAIYVYMEKNTRFANRVAEARDSFASSLEHEAVRRGRDGYFEPVYQNGELIGHKQRYSDRLLETTLRAAMPEKYGKQTIELTGNEAAPIALSAIPAKHTPIDIDAMREANGAPESPALLYDGD